MQVPYNMTTPPMKLDADEEIFAKVEAFRKKGIFGNRYGELYLTNKRVAFVKAIMKTGLISAVISAKGAKPMLEFARASGTNVTKGAWKKFATIEVTDGTKSERFALTDELADVVMRKLSAV